MKKKLAIIGASYLQEPLISKAKEMGIETHVFAWKANDIGEKIADYFYPISITEKDAILNKCKEIGINGAVTIATDLGAVTANYVANGLGLPCNSPEASLAASNKHVMRKVFEDNGDPSPKSFLVSSFSDLKNVDIAYPVIVKPIDRSGSRGITKLYSEEGIDCAIEKAKTQGFIKKALVEEFAEGLEYSVECITYHGQHHFLAMTLKYTTGAPNFIEKGHVEPAPISEDMLEVVKATVFHALTSLGITNSASHSEIKIDKYGNIKIIEIGGRMGGDRIGSDLVHLSTGIDFVKAVIEVSLGQEPDLQRKQTEKIAAIRYIFSEDDILNYKKIKEKHPDWIVNEEIKNIEKSEITDSSTRFGDYLFCAPENIDIRNICR